MCYMHLLIAAGHRSAGHGVARQGKDMFVNFHQDIIARPSSLQSTCAPGGVGDSGVHRMAPE